MYASAECPACDETVTLEDPEEGDREQCPECGCELTVSLVDLKAVPYKLVLSEDDEEEDDVESDDGDDESDDDEEDDELEDDDDETES
jgi:hypothetical protein